MQKGFSENTEEFDRQYKEGLKDIEISPGDHLWTNINEYVAPLNVQGARIRFLSRLLIGSVVINILTFSYIFLNYERVDNDSQKTAVVKNKISEPIPLKNESDQKIISQLSEKVYIDKKIFKKNNLDNRPVVNVENVNRETEKEILINNAPQLISNEEVKEEAEASQKEVEEKKSPDFYEKYSQNKKDSLHKLFVPVK